MMGPNAEALVQEEEDGNVRGARGVGTAIARDSHSFSGVQVGEKARATARGCDEDQRGVYQDVWGSARGVLLQHLAGVDG